MEVTPTVYLTETPRDAMQGWQTHIPAPVKAKYINHLINCGFDCVDVGSFVSPKAIPQMADTAEVISLLQTKNSKSNLMSIVGNERGGKQACNEEKIQLIGFPFSVSTTFLKNNLNTTIEKAFQTIFELNRLASEANKSTRIYISMAFGNPYGDAWNDEIVLQSVEKLYNEGIHDIVFSDITNEATPGNIERLCSEIIQEFEHLNLGIHLHTGANKSYEKLEAAWHSGITRFESAIGGYGGCPMTGYELVSNLNTSDLLQFLTNKGISSGINEKEFTKAVAMANNIFRNSTTEY